MNPIEVQQVHDSFDGLDARLVALRQRLGVPAREPADHTVDHTVGDRTAAPAVVRRRGRLNRRFAAGAAAFAVTFTAAVSVPMTHPAVDVHRIDGHLVVTADRPVVPAGTVVVVDGTVTRSDGGAGAAAIVAIPAPWAAKA